MKTKFKIEVLNEPFEQIDGQVSSWGKITIGEFQEHFVMLLCDWTIKSYQKQWIDGLKRILLEPYSCLVSSIENLKTNPAIETWNMYKPGNGKVYFQNSLVIEETIEHKQLVLQEFESKNAHLYIDFPREEYTQEGRRISEWKMSEKDFTRSTEQLIKNLIQESLN